MNLLLKKKKKHGKRLQFGLAQPHSQINVNVKVIPTEVDKYARHSPADLRPGYFG